MPEKQIKNELSAEVTLLQNKVSSLSNIVNGYNLQIEGLQGEVQTLESTKEEKLAELSAVETDLKNALESAAAQKESSSKEVSELATKVTDLEASKKTIEGELAEINAAIVVATQAQRVCEESLTKAQDAHRAFTAHAASEKARILDELKGLDEAAKAQVAVIESQTAVQTTLDEQNSTKEAQNKQLDTDIESKTERLSTVTTELQTLEETHAARMKAAQEEFDTFMSETTKATATAAEALKKVEAELEGKTKLAISLVEREGNLNQREQFIKDLYAKANINW